MELESVFNLYYDCAPVPESRQHMKHVGGEQCGACYKRASSWCKQCLVTAYCSSACQKTDWKEGLHKLVCKPNPAPAKQIEELYRVLQWRSGSFCVLREQMLAFAMGTHERLGKKTALNVFTTDVMKLILVFRLEAEITEHHKPVSAVHVPALGKGNLGSTLFRNKAQDSLEELREFDALGHSKREEQCAKFRWQGWGGQIVPGYTGHEGTHYLAVFDDLFQSSQHTHNPVAACLFNSGAFGSFVVCKVQQIWDEFGSVKQVAVTRAEVFNLAMARLASLVNQAVTDRMWRLQMRQSADHNQEHAWNQTAPQAFSLVDDAEGGGEARGRNGGGGAAADGGAGKRSGKEEVDRGASQLEQGAWVRISGLARAVELNGQVGVVQSGEGADGRVPVEVEDGGRRGRRVVNTRVCNLVAVLPSEMTTVVRLCCDGELGLARKVEELRVPRAHRVFEGGEPARILHLAGFPLHLAPCAPRCPLQEQRDHDNQWATFLMIDPLSGFAPPHWQSFVGPVLAFRPSGAPLSSHDAVICFEFADCLLDKYDPSDPAAVRPERDITPAQLARAARSYVANHPSLRRAGGGLAELVHVPM